MSPGDSLFIKEKLLLGKLALKSKVAGLLGAKAKVLAVPKLALKGAVAKIGLKPAVAKLGLKGVHIGGIGGIGAVGGLSQIAGIQQIGGVQHIEQDHHSFEFNENPILIPHPEPVVEHIYAPPPPPQVIIPAPPPQVIIQHQEPAPVYTAEISSVPVSIFLIIFFFLKKSVVK